MNNYKYLFQKFLRKNVRSFRSRNSLSQERMAELLHVSPRSYFDQEHGKYGFSALSLASYLLLLSDDEVLIFLRELRALVEQIEKGNVA